MFVITYQISRLLALRSTETTDFKKLAFLKESHTGTRTSNERTDTRYQKEQELGSRKRFHTVLTAARPPGRRDDAETMKGR